MASQALANGGLASIFASDLTGGRNLADLTAGVIVRNILDKTKMRNRSLYSALTVIVPYLLLTGGALGVLQQFADLPTQIKKIGALLSSPLNAMVTIPPNNPLNQDVLQWLVAKGLGGKPKSLTLYDPEAEGAVANEIDRQMGYLEEAEQAQKVHDEPGSNKPKPLKYIPGYGQYKFFFRHRVFTVKRKTPREKNNMHGQPVDINPSTPTPLEITCSPTMSGTKPIEDFLDHVRGFAEPPKFDCTTVYRPEYQSGGYMESGWIWKGVKRPIRKLDSIALEAAKKNAVLNDISQYLTPECERWYSSRGIPYRRGMLLYGPPGTGKTSFSIALAGCFGLNLYVLSLSDRKLNDQYIEKLFDILPKRCIVLLEDVDSAGLKRESIDVKGPETKKKGPGGKQSGITLSGLLNVIDGPASRDGRIMLMTSNAPDSLDAALIRPGRCDRKILFGYANAEICTKLFTHIYCASPEELVAGENNAAEEHDVAALAKEFASKIPADSQISPAEVQGYLMLHRKDPLAAIKGAEVFAQELIDIKARGAKVAAFNNEVAAKGDGEAFGPKAEGTSDNDAESIEQEAASGAADATDPYAHLQHPPSSPIFGNGWLDQAMRAHGIDPEDYDAMSQWRNLREQGEYVEGRVRPFHDPDDDDDDDWDDEDDDEEGDEGLGNLFDEADGQDGADDGEGGEGGEDVEGADNLGQDGPGDGVIEDLGEIQEKAMANLMRKVRRANAMMAAGKRK